MEIFVDTIGEIPRDVQLATQNARNNLYAMPEVVGAMIEKFCVIIWTKIVINEII